LPCAARARTGTRKRAQRTWRCPKPPDTHEVVASGWCGGNRTGRGGDRALDRTYRVASVVKIMVRRGVRVGEPELPEKTAAEAEAAVRLVRLLQPVRQPHEEQERRAVAAEEEAATDGRHLCRAHRLCLPGPIRPTAQPRYRCGTGQLWPQCRSANVGRA
jgi:hypothetical protein